MHISTLMRAKWMHRLLPPLHFVSKTPVSMLAHVCPRTRATCTCKSNTEAFRQSTQPFVYHISLHALDTRQPVTLLELVRITHECRGSSVPWSMLLLVAQFEEVLYRVLPRIDCHHMIELSRLDEIWNAAQAVEFVPTRVVTCCARATAE